MKRNLQSFGAVPVPELLGALQTATEGLGEEEVERRLKQYGSNLLFKSRPGRYLLIATLLMVAVTLILPFTPLGRLFGFTRLSILFLLFVGVIMLFYIVGAELAKAAFYQKMRF